MKRPWVLKNPSDYYVANRLTGVGQPNTFAQLKMFTGFLLLAINCRENDP